jgi:hypothetical protein
MKIAVALVDHGSAIATPTPTQSASGAKETRQKRVAADTGRLEGAKGTGARQGGRPCSVTFTSKMAVAREAFVSNRPKG